MYSKAVENWFIIRADANVNIGIGHVMRCLALAEWLTEQGIIPVLLSKTSNDFIVSKLASLGGKLYLLNESLNEPDKKYQHSSWLKGTEEDDAKVSTNAIEELIQFEYKKNPLFIMVDHYSIGAPWEEQLKEIAPILVVDDLSDRKHNCNWLVDQTYGKTSGDYNHLVPSTAKLFIGPKYGLLRKEFSQITSQPPRVFKQKNIKVLISLGGIDKNNDACKVLSYLSQYKLITEIAITIVTSSANPNLKKLTSYISTLTYVNLLVDVNDMATLFKTYDICIGAAGSTSWERCAMSMPTLCVVIAENQETIADNLEAANAIINLGLIENLTSTELLYQFEKVCQNEDFYTQLSHDAYALCDGLGCGRIIKEIIN